jgi:hypothetical protein
MELVARVIWECISDFALNKTTNLKRILKETVTRKHENFLLTNDFAGGEHKF